MQWIQILNPGVLNMAPSKTCIAQTMGNSHPNNYPKKLHDAIGNWYTRCLLLRIEIQPK